MSEIILKTKAFVENLLSNKLDANFLYHNLRHTQRVVKSTKELLDTVDLSAQEKEALLLASWLHDTGYTMGCQKHEENSCTIAREFLSGLNYSTQKIAAVEHYIMATERNASPKNISEKIIRDADSSHFAQKSYLETSELLKDELHALKIASYTPKEWQEANIKMFKQEHAYYTDHAKEHWQPKKEKNLKKIIKAKKENKAIIQKEALKAKLKSESPDRGIQTLYRVTLKNHGFLK